ncbi:hypothetical protein GFS03_12895 [Sulfolobus sp. E5-1-F]|uniref:hypothetical protein n=1 Tax=Saccharolobus sp. E5-1-F TaxID=2663019 RepID=UPI001295DCB8|nr:hypothetical protein [Sulfolobus sp. E5-1-F]QGA55401.1 hypothetical protein GFS03_12895 [Sulfolobus sp. E5-1-F]
MLAYVFWHQIGTSNEEEYERNLVAFHDYFNKNAKIEGYLGSLVVRVNYVPWAEGDAYEDWYFMQSSKTLDLINKAVLEIGDIKEIHDRIARIAKNGKGGLYGIVKGDILSPSYTYAYWISKPSGMKYENFYKEIEPFSQNLWRRQLAMGPLSEFCVFSKTPLNVSQKFSPIYQQRRLLYSNVQITTPP